MGEKDNSGNPKWIVGAIVTDNAGQCGRGCRILAPRWTQIAFLKCFAHDINNLVKAVLNSTFKLVAAQVAAVVNTLNASSSKWLVEAKGSIVRTYGYHLCLCSFCATRWNSMQGCFASLLRVKTTLQLLADDCRFDPEFPESLRILNRPSFWEELAYAEDVIRLHLTGSSATKIL